MQRPETRQLIRLESRSNFAVVIFLSAAIAILSLDAVSFVHRHFDAKSFFGHHHFFLTSHHHSLAEKDSVASGDRPVEEHSGKKLPEGDSPDQKSPGQPYLTIAIELSLFQPVQAGDAGGTPATVWQPLLLPTTPKPTMGEFFDPASPRGPPAS